MVSNEAEKCYIFPIFTILLFLTTCCELFKLVYEFYQLFVKYKYKIQQVKLNFSSDAILQVTFVCLLQ